MTQPLAPIHMIGFYSSTKKVEKVEGIVLTLELQENGKYPYTFHCKAFKDNEEFKNLRNNEQLIQFLEKLEYRDLEFFPSNDWLGLQLLSTVS